MKSFEFLYFAKNVVKSLSDKYTPKLLDTATRVEKSWSIKVATDAFKTKMSKKSRS